MNAADGTQGKTLVHLAAEHGLSLFVLPSQMIHNLGQLTLLERLVARDAKLHVKTRATRDTPAHLAVRKGHFKVCNYAPLFFFTVFSIPDSALSR